MENKKNDFEKKFGFSAPKLLVDFCEDGLVQRLLPVGFRFKHVGFVVEIEYLVDIWDPSNQDVDRKIVAFAKSTDGFSLLADLKTEDLVIIQREFGDEDSIGITIKDLLEAEKYSLYD